ncbi:MAG: PHP domain-containing protein [Candidatus Improbicoccus devescovinae]|nr:MAG: PHP domain-containing protein [Candidatus Improbicoccus devescovinae]
MTIDLHCHSKLSDGSAGIGEIMFIARRTKIDTIAITDHDTFAGAVRAQVIGKRYGLNVILGAEFSAFSMKYNREIHILCYMCEYVERLGGLCQHNTQIRQRSIAIALQKIMKYYPISSQIVATKARGSTNVFKNHILQSVMDAGYNTHNYTGLFNKLFDSSSDSTIFSPPYSEPSEVIKSIHQAEGIAILAHPVADDVHTLLPELVESGLDGVEAYFPGVSESECDNLVEFANNNNLIITGGSNFHGMYSPTSRLLGSYKTSEDQLELMRKKKSKMV